MDLCGHATLASAYIIRSFVDINAEHIDFFTKSGTLPVDYHDGLYEMDFPSRPPERINVLPEFSEAIGCDILEAHLSRDLLLLVKDESTLKGIIPNLEMMRKFKDGFGVIVTAKGDDVDFVSRFFAPGAGIPEDPVTGSSHCTLIPFWAERLGKKEMVAKQLSRRGGTLYCKDCGERVKIAGQAALYLTGTISYVYERDPSVKPLDQITDEERARLFPIILSEYNPAWPEWFAEEKANLERLIDTDNISRISHYGSTSVPGLLAKPTVDILMEINEDADVDKLIAAMPSPEYICLYGSSLTMPTPPPHLMIIKGYTPTGFAEKVYHIHVVYPSEHDELFFRDYLIAHPETAAEYAALKRRLIKDFEYDRDGYTDAKGEFIRAVTEKERMGSESYIVQTADLDTLKSFTFVVIFARYKDKWLYCRAKEREVFETAGGHIEPGETPLEAAKRELYEETGALAFDIEPAFDYSVKSSAGYSTGQVFFAKIHELGEIPDYEMAEVRLFDTIPDRMRFPQILPVIYEKMAKHIC